MTDPTMERPAEEGGRLPDLRLETLRDLAPDLDAGDLVAGSGQAPGGNCELGTA